MAEAPGGELGEPPWAAGTLFCWHLLTMMEPCPLFRAGVTTMYAGQAPDTQSVATPLLNMA